jgi:hypothetical protein
MKEIYIDMFSPVESNLLNCSYLKGEDGLRGSGPLSIQYEQRARLNADTSSGTKAYDRTAMLFLGVGALKQTTNSGAHFMYMCIMLVKTAIQLERQQLRTF